MLKGLKERLRHISPLSQVPRDCLLAISAFADLQNFVKKHELWKGLKTYRWLGMILFAFGILFSISFISFSWNYWSGIKASEGQMSIAAISNRIGDFIGKGYESYYVGGIKYVILLLMEVVIFHFTRRTLEILTGNQIDSSFKEFMRAQKRAFQVVFYSFIMETLLTAIFSFALEILGVELVIPVFVFLIQSFYLGFAVVDNYNELFHMSINQSARYTESYASVALLIGIVVHILMLVPFVGPVVGPLVGAVVATISMHELHSLDNKMEWVFDRK